MLIGRQETQSPARLLHGAGKVSRHSREVAPCERDPRRQRLKRIAVDDDHGGRGCFRSLPAVACIEPPFGIAEASSGCLHLADPLALPTAVGTVLVMAWLVQHSFPGARLLAFMGGASYAMYLWHRDLLLTFGVEGLLIAAIGSAASWALVERPILEWGHRIAARFQRVRPADPAMVPSPVRT